MVICREKLECNIVWQFFLYKIFHAEFCKFSILVVRNQIQDVFILWIEKINIDSWKLDLFGTITLFFSGKYSGLEVLKDYCF